MDAPPSANSGWLMATLTIVLDVRLTKPGVYTLNGDAALPSVERARRGVRVVDHVALVAFRLTGMVAWF